MSMPQAIPSVQVGPGLSAWRDNSTQPFARPVPHILVANSQAAWFENAPSRAVGQTPATVQVNGVLLFRETAQSLKQAP